MTTTKPRTEPTPKSSLRIKPTPDEDQAKTKKNARVSTKISSRKRLNNINTKTKTN